MIADDYGVYNDEQPYTSDLEQKANTEALDALDAHSPMAVHDSDMHETVDPEECGEELLTHDDDVDFGSDDAAELPELAEDPYQEHDEGGVEIVADGDSSSNEDQLAMPSLRAVVDAADRVNGLSSSTSTQENKEQTKQPVADDMPSTSIGMAPKAKSMPKKFKAIIKGESKGNEAKEVLCKGEGKGNEPREITSNGDSKGTEAKEVMCRGESKGNEPREFTGRGESKGSAPREFTCKGEWSNREPERGISRKGDRRGRVLDGGGKHKGAFKGKAKGKGKDDTGKDGKGRELDRGGFAGFIYQDIPTTGTLLIKCRHAVDKFGQEAVIPKENNPAGAKVGDRINFDVEGLVQEGEGEPRPLATNVVIKEPKERPSRRLPLTDLKTQVLHYLSDENLRTDKFFHDIITSSEGGWVSTTHILGCKRIKQLGATTKTVVEALCGAPGIEVRDVSGQEAVRRTSPPPPLDVVENATEVMQTCSSQFCVEKDDIVYAGVVTDQSKSEPHQFFITCETVAQRHGRDAFFLPSQKPQGVEIGSIVAFTVPLDIENGNAPQVNFLAEMAPLGPAVLAAPGSDVESSQVYLKKRCLDGTFK